MSNQSNKKGTDILRFSQTINSSDNDDFEPSVFKIPDFINQDKTPIKKTEKLVHLEKQAKLEKKKNEITSNINNQLINKTVLNNLTIEQSNERKNILKNILSELKSELSKLESNNSDNLKETLEKIYLAVIKLKKCYQTESFKADENTLEIIKSLLKCQYYKCKYLKDNKIPNIPDIESKLLNRLKTLSGFMVPLERSAFYKTIITINKIILLVKFNDLPKAKPEEIYKINNNENSSEEPEIDLSNFNALNANRTILKLKAQIKRTFAEKDKEDLLNELNLLLKQQKAYNQQKISNSFKRNSTILIRYKLSIEKDYKNKNLNQKEINRKLQQNIKLVIQNLQLLLRLCSSNKDNPEIAELVQSCILQLSRIGIGDEKEFIYKERSLNIDHLKKIQNNKLVKTEILNWSDKFILLIDSILPQNKNTNTNIKIEEINNKIINFDNYQKSFDKNKQEVLILEEEYIKSKNSSDKSNLKGKLTKIYAKLFLDLPK